MNFANTYTQFVTIKEGIDIKQTLILHDLYEDIGFILVNNEVAFHIKHGATQWPSEFTLEDGETFADFYIDYLIELISA